MRELRQSETIIGENPGVGVGEQTQTRFVKSVIIRKVGGEVKAAINI